MIASESGKTADTVHLLVPEPHSMQEQEQQLESLIRVIAEEFFSMSAEEQASFERPAAPTGLFVETQSSSTIQ